MVSFKTYMFWTDFLEKKSLMQNILPEVLILYVICKTPSSCVHLPSFIFFSDRAPHPCSGASVSTQKSTGLDLIGFAFNF